MLRYKNIQVTIKIKYPEIKNARRFLDSIRKSLEPDDKDISHYIKISYNFSDNSMEIRLSTTQKIESIEGVLNDLFRCLRSAIYVLEYSKTT